MRVLTEVSLLKLLSVCDHYFWSWDSAQSRECWQEADGSCDQFVSRNKLELNIRLSNYEEREAQRSNRPVSLKSSLDIHTQNHHATHSISRIQFLTEKTWFNITQSFRSDVCTDPSDWELCVVLFLTSCFPVHKWEMRMFIVFLTNKCQTAVFIVVAE